MIDNCNKIQVHGQCSKICVPQIKTMHNAQIFGIFLNFTGEIVRLYIELKFFVLWLTMRNVIFNEHHNQRSTIQAGIEAVC